MRMPKHIEPSRPHTLREVREIERQPEPEPSKEADDSREDQMSFDLCGDEEQPVRCRDQPGEHHLAPQEVVAGQHVDTLLPEEQEQAARRNEHVSHVATWHAT